MEGRSYREWLAHQIRIHLRHRLNGCGLDFIVDNGTAGLAQAAENPFDHHVVAFPYIRLSESDDFYGAGCVLEKKTECWLAIAIRCQLIVGHASADRDDLMIVMVGMSDEFRDLDQDGRRERADRHGHQYRGKRQRYESPHSHSCPDRLCSMSMMHCFMNYTKFIRE